MNQRIYKLYTSSVTSANAAATLRIGKAGILTGVFWAVRVLGGASVDGRIDYELSLSNVISNTTNDTPGNVLSMCELTTNVTSAVNSCNVFHGGFQFHLDEQTQLYVNVAASGTAMTSGIASCFFTILEDK